MRTPANPPAPDMLALRRALVRAQFRILQGEDCLSFDAEVMGVLAGEACEEAAQSSRPAQHEESASIGR